MCETGSHGGKTKFIIIFPKKRIKNTSLYFERTPSKHEPGTSNQTEKKVLLLHPDHTQ